MEDNKTIAAILTAGYNAVSVRDTVEPETVMHTYETFETFRKLLHDQDKKERHVPTALKDLAERAIENGKKRAS